MGTNNRVKDRRQERIRQILEQQQANAQMHIGGQPLQQEVPLLLSDLPHAELPPQAQPKSNGRPVQPLHPDPEKAWKQRSSPWEETASWSSATKLKEVDRRRTDPDGGERDPGRPGAIIRGLYIQTIIAGVLFAMIFAVFKIDHPIAKKGQEVVTAALTDTIDFDSAAAWYRQTFAGAPSFIPLFQDADSKDSVYTEGDIELPVIAPVSGGSIVRTFAETLSGVEIAVKPEEAVLAAETGRVTLVSGDAQSGKTVVIQHANDRVTIYGSLQETNVAANDWVEAGQQIGKLQGAADNGTSLLFFAVKEKGKYVDPAGVVPLD